MEVIFDDKELIFNCGNFLISVKCSVLISFSISDLFLISNEVPRKRQMTKMEVIRRTKSSRLIPVKLMT